MVIVYFDSSAFVKLVVQEDGSEVAAALWDGGDAVVSSRLAYPEVQAALAAAGRDHRLDGEAERQATASWEDYWSAIRPVELTEGVSAHAGRLAASYGLRGADAVHLASALAVSADELVFAAWDRRLRSGVRDAGVALAPAAEPDGPQAHPGRPA